MPKAHDSIAAGPPEAICLACGLCCDGTLFGDVRLQPGDDPAAFKALGLPVAAPPRARGEVSKAASRGKVGTKIPIPGAKLVQPCAAFDGCRCRIYSSRPIYCREFECALLKKAKAGEVSAPDALRIIRKSRRRVEAVLAMLRELGDDDEGRPLAARFRRITRRMESSELTPERAESYGRLTLAFQDLMILVLSREFYPGS